MSLKKIEFKKNYSLKKHTSIKIGGKAKYFLIADNEDILAKALADFKGKFYLLGGGSNLLIKDSIIKLPVIKLGKNFDYAKQTKKGLEAGAATLLSPVLNYCIKKNLGGLENLVGIPATVGGLLVMNASSFGREISALLREIEIMEDDGSITKLKRKDINFSYRDSSLSAKYSANHNERTKIILRAWFAVKKDKNLKEKMNSFLSNRLRTQDFEFPSCGCIFKNPSSRPELAAGFLIDSCGLKGLRKNDAQISRKHANFIINTGNASYNDIDYLIRLIKDKVYKKFAIGLEEEIERWT